jgi:F-type H+-transporting ATPase subunit delta
MKSDRQARREAKQLFRLCLIDGLADENRVNQVARAIATGGGRDARRILGHFLRRAAQDRANRNATVDCAVPLTEQLRAAIQADLVRRYGAGVITAFRHCPELIGGVRIQVGSHLYDGSVRAALAALEKSF